MDLDLILDAAKEDDIINLQEGEYWTLGHTIGSNKGSLLKAGCQLIGAGKDKTLIKFKTPTVFDDDYIVLLGKGDNCLVSDLTVDCMVSSPLESYSNFKIQGLNLVGSFCILKNCKVINPFGNYSQQRECFPLKIFDGQNNLIENCEVSQIKGTYVSAIGLNNGEIRGCRVIFPVDPFEARIRFWVAYNLEGAKNSKVYNNYSCNSLDGYYTDTETTDGLEIFNNQFINVQRGIHINMQQSIYENTPSHGVQNVSIHDNFITFKYNVPYFAAFELDHTMTPYNPTGICTQNWINNIKFYNNIASCRDSRRIAYDQRMMFNIASQTSGVGPELGICNLIISGNKENRSDPNPLIYRNMKNNAKNIITYEKVKWSQV